jgi:hypothetical protein
MVAACLLAVFALVTGVHADDYGKWGKDEKARTYTCDYSYDTKDGGKNTQKAVIYYADPDRKDWCYFFNAKNEPWARCAVPGNKDYNPNQMYWQQVNEKKDGYSDYTQKTYCPAPADGKRPIATLPLPPK